VIIQKIVHDSIKIKFDNDVTHRSIIKQKMQSLHSSIQHENHRITLNSLSKPMIYAK